MTTKQKPTGKTYQVKNPHQFLLYLVMGFISVGLMDWAYQYIFDVEPLPIIIIFTTAITVITVMFIRFEELEEVD